MEGKGTCGGRDGWGGSRLGCLEGRGKGEREPGEREVLMAATRGE